jgi:5-methylcytosine-specific restriction protein A
MPTKAPRACVHGGCAGYATTGNYCDLHRKALWAERNARPEIRDDKRFYDSAIWQSKRKAVLRLEPWCRECRRNGRVTPATMVDHIQGIRSGGARLSDSNLQPLCDACHAVKRSDESRGKVSF